MAKVLAAATWLQFPGGNLFVIHFCSFDREWDGFRQELIVRDWLEAAHILRVALPEDELGEAIERLKYHGASAAIVTTSERMAVLGFEAPMAQENAA